MKSTKSYLIVLLFLCLPALIFAAENELKVVSPDGKIEVKIDLKRRIYYTIYYKEDVIINPSPLSLTINEGVILGNNPKLIESKTKSVNEKIEPVWGRRKIIDNVYNEISLKFDGNFGIRFKVYNDAVAYSFNTALKGEMIVQNEEASFNFTKDHDALIAETSKFDTSFETIRKWVKLNDMNEQRFAHAPMIVKLDNGLKVVLTEANVRDYPGMYYSRYGDSNRPWLSGLFAPYPEVVEQGGWCNFSMKVKSAKDYIAKTEGTREFPWRIMVITEDDRNLPQNDIVYKLADPAEIETDWIQPGKVTWEWWNDWNLEGVDFKSGINNETYKYYIDFAAKNGLEYLIMDEGWSDQFDVTMPVPGVDMPILVEYAKEKGVKIILWCVWHTLDRQMQEAFRLFDEWEIAGVKVDFIDRDDQLAMEFFERCAREAAKHQLLVDYHGCPKPTGMNRTFPNIINYEGVVGNEYNKGGWGGNIPTPDHNVTIAFTRMMAGPMDYTPGAMRNANQTDFSLSNTVPMSPGTRCHQLAMYIVYDAPLQMLCDAPTQYEKYPDILNFLSKVPVTWDETDILQAELQKYIITMREKDGIYYLGGMTDWTGRDLKISLDFLPEGTFQMISYEDGTNAEKLATDYKVKNTGVTNKSEISIKMAPGGGFASYFVKVN